MTEGDGDDESIVITTADVSNDVHSIVLGLACYSATDFSHAPNPHFRAVDGTTESDSQIADVKMGTGTAGDTLLKAFTLTRTDSGWTLINNDEYSQSGNGGGCIKAFGEMFK